MKVKSAVIRLVKHRFDEEKIEIPDSSREMVFARELPVRLIESNGRRVAPSPVEPKPAVKKSTSPEQVATSSEGGLASEAENLKQQAECSRAPEGGEDLLKERPATSNS